ncbi:MAG: N-acetyltransferase [Pseudomonadota bacterium]
MIIRAEQTGEQAIIHALTARAFATMPFSNGSEPRIIDALRRSGDLTLSLVAAEGAEIVGQITFSPVTIDGVQNAWFGLGPVSVDPDRQRTGIGSQLIRQGLTEMTSLGAHGIVLVGDPAYYSRFGFEGDVGLSYPGVEPRYVQRLVISPPDRQGTVRYADAFEASARDV